MTTTRVHLTRIRPGRLAEVIERIERYQADGARLRDLGIRSLMFFTTTELAEHGDGLVVAVIEAEDEDAVIRFLDANEASDDGQIGRLYVSHGHDIVRQAIPRFRIDV